MIARRTKPRPRPRVRRTAQAQLRLAQLFELTKLFASFQDLEQTFDPALVIASRTLPLRSAILIEEEAGRSRMIIWPSKGRTAVHMRAARKNAEQAYTYLMGETPTDLNLTELSGKTRLPWYPATHDTRYIVIPLVVAHQPPFGVLQVEGAAPFDKMDLMFINAIANQLATALDRDRAWRRDIVAREEAEVRQVIAEAQRTAAERAQVLADSAKNEFQALAEENAALYAEARQAVGVREQILAIVSHDLRSPLGTLLMATSLLTRGAGEEERRTDLVRHAGMIKRSAERMLRLIEDLLDFASIEAGSLAIKRKPEEAGSLLRETLATFESTTTLKQQRLTADVDAGLPPLSCDRDRILQVLSNLVGNATKATANGGHIAISVKARAEDLVFAVSDTGPGINEVEAKHLFERYWRGEKSEYKGTGLGLAIAQGLVDAHGGRIWVDSVVGHGTTFSFSLPLTDPLSPALRN